MQKSTSSSSSSSSSSTSAPPQLVALPSLSCQLSSLPQARSLDHVSLHHNSMSAQRAAESEAKLVKVLSKSGGSHSVAFAPSYGTAPTMSGSYSPSNNSPPLMMRKPAKKIPA
ncbi:hypothetical protein DAEQUDRAFT_725059 [Daedalea quercina L-15889]|uniref:Uncharacterized protein n=1 Tax=Daedalea quercina L-15889 TaxID=1314783 RepID=A0A165RBQ1_9APHY|nr:hypothetical protein DAEQUDRAFT_725059 [Daedalea quercina L-15889]